jgi:hypothetical protein
VIELRDDGTAVIEFPSGPVTIRPPKYGALKRLDAERQRISDQVADVIMGFGKLEPIPKEQPEPTDEERAERTRIVRLHRARVEQINELNLDSMIQMWRFILLGNRGTEGGGDFDGLADPRPSSDPDEWPGSLLYDHREPFTLDGDDLVANVSLLDRMFQHWKKVRFRPGPKPVET